MPKLEGERVERVHVLLFESDIQTLRRRYGSDVGFGPAVRLIVRAFLKRLDQTDPIPSNAELELDPESTL